jgi:hypothetical protein
VSQLPKGIIYTVFVSAGIGDGLGASSERATVVAMDVVTLISASYQEPNKVLVTWNRVDGATTYSFQLVASNGQPANLAISPVNATQAETQTNEMDVTSLPDDTYSVQVMANNGAVQSGWSTGIPVTIKRLTPDSLATQLHDQKVIAPNAAPQIVAAFPDQFATNPGALITLLQAHFAESTTSLTQLAWALSKSSYDSQSVTQALAKLPKTQLADVFAAMKGAYPTTEVQQQITQLTSTNVPAQSAAQQIYAAHADFNALQMGVLLIINFASTVQTSTLMAQALQPVGYNADDALKTLQQIYPLDSLADLIAAIRSAYPAS